MAWFKRKEKGITTATEDKMDVPKVFGISLLQEKIDDADELERLFVSPEDGFHVRIGSSTYFEILFDNNEFVELDKT
jgi:acetyl-CoA carboxylase carboxyl transferase subunit beta